MAYWWDGDSRETFWVEIRKRSGTGLSLWAPNRDEKGRRNAYYELVHSVRAGETIYHWNARQHRIVGRSLAASDAIENTAENYYEVQLRDFTPVAALVDLEAIRSMADRLYLIRDEIQAIHGNPTYLPFQYKQDRSQFGLMSNYFAKLPRSMVELMFGSDGLATDLLPEDEPTAPNNVLSIGATSERQSRCAFLAPFRPKADAEYVAMVRARSEQRTRRHETLVNDCAHWLASEGFTPSCNAAIDLGLVEPSVIFEAKPSSGRLFKHVRDAVGQLYEYRYFKVADPNAALVFLTDDPLPERWVEYLEGDRGIGIVWRRNQRFECSPIAKKALRW